ncbi:hypothetical protein TWF694_002716 [Orbilia ellipsospora]|uniref:Extracellular serine-rich protein n=1 Tax=Orbilia ellipsospora TaxID=2528407 RepID=A0AAV9X477_9PEZI
MRTIREGASETGAHEWGNNIRWKTIYDSISIAGYLYAWQCRIFDCISIMSTRRKHKAFMTNITPTIVILLFLNFQICAAKIVDVMVGFRDNSLQLLFTPEIVYQDVGQEVRFQFYPQNHSVAQSSFENPCTPLGGESSSAGFFSGFNAVAKIDDSIPTFTINISSSDPIYFYCAQGRHCQSGMVGVINPPSSDTINSFKAAASKVPLTQVPLTPPTQDLPSPEFSVSSSSVLPGATNVDPQYTPNAVPKSSSKGGLSTSGYIAVAGVGLLLVIIVAIVIWCKRVRKKQRKARERRRAEYLERERRRQRGKEVGSSSRGEHAYRDVDGDAVMIDLEALRVDPQGLQATYAYSFRRPSVNSSQGGRTSSVPRRHSSMLVQRPLSHVSPIESGDYGRRFSANVINIEPRSRSSTVSTYHHHRMSMPSTSHSMHSMHSRNVPSRRHSTMSMGMSAQQNRNSILRKPSPSEQTRYQELQKLRVEQKKEEDRKSKQPSPIPSLPSLQSLRMRSSPSPQTVPKQKWKIFKKSTYRRRIEVREIDIHDTNRHKTPNGGKNSTPSPTPKQGESSSGAGGVDKDSSTRSGTATTAVETSGRVDTSYTTNSKDMRGGGSISN